MDEAFCGEAEINVEEIMQQIRAEAEKRSITETVDLFTGIPLTQNVDANMVQRFSDSMKLEKWVSELNASYPITYPPITNRNPLKRLIKKGIRFVRKIRSVPNMARQNQINENVIRCINSIVVQLDYQKHYISMQEKTIQELQKQLKELT